MTTRMYRCKKPTCHSSVLTFFFLNPPKYYKKLKKDEFFGRGSERRKSEHQRVRTSKRILERSERQKSLRQKHDRKSLRRKSE
jgi:hypothetical protein